MNRDTSEIQIHDCASIVDDQTIITYDSTHAYTYKLVGDKYYLSSTTDGPINGTVTCYGQDQINHLASRYDFMTPIYHEMAIISVIAIFWIAYRLILYPFFRTKI